MKKIDSTELCRINGGASGNGCGTVGFMWVVSYAAGNLIGGSYYSTLAGICWDN